MIWNARRWHVLARRMALGIGVASLAIGATASPVAAANNISIDGYLGDCTFLGSNVVPGKSATVEWRDSDGNLKSKQKLVAASTGQITVRCEFSETLEAGDVIRTYAGGAWRTHVVPKLTVNVDREADTVFGKVSPPPATPNRMWVSVDTYNGGFVWDPNSGYTSQSIAINNQDYEVTSWFFPAPDIKGLDDVYVHWESPTWDHFVRYIRAEAMQVWVRQSYVDVVGNPGRTVDIALDKASTVQVGHASGRFDFNGELAAAFYDDDGDTVRTAPGDEVTGDFATDAHFTVPTIAASINKTTDRVTADCGLGPDRGIAVDAHRRDFSSGQTRAGMTTSSPSVANFASAPKFDIKSGDKIDVYCKLDTGDVVARTFTVI